MGLRDYEQIRGKIPPGLVAAAWIGNQPLQRSPQAGGVENLMQRHPGEFGRKGSQGAKVRTVDPMLARDEKPGRGEIDAARNLPTAVDRGSRQASRSGQEVDDAIVEPLAPARLPKN